MTADDVTKRLRTFFHEFITLGFKVDHPHEGWVFDEEPHVQRRQAILKAHPEVCATVSIIYTYNQSKRICGFLFKIIACLKVFLIKNVFS